MLKISAKKIALNRRTNLYKSRDETARDHLIERHAVEMMRNN